MSRKSVLGVLVAGVTALLVAGCGGQTATTGAAPSATAPTVSTAVSSEHNAADVTFAQQMIPHHQQAVAMAKLADSRAGNGQVKQLATRVQAAQDPEIAQMQGFLATWGAPATGGMSSMPGMTSTPSDGMGSMPGMDGGTAMPGMMSNADMTNLGKASGAEFNRMFLQMMTAHHQGAITMAKTELADGINPQAKTLAQNIIAAQQGEITEMSGLLNSL
jgi:uncharacterized protein (DUF305 family)